MLDFDKIVAGNKNPLISIPKKDGSLHHALKNVLFTMQIVGMLPIEGIGKDPKSLKFKWIGIQSFVCCLLTMGLSVYASIVFWYMINESINNFISFFWLVRSNLILLAFVQIGYKWAKFMEEWCLVENEMANWPGTNLKKKFDLIGLAFLLFGIVNYLTFIYDGISQTLNSKDKDLSTYYLYQYPEIFLFEKVALWKVLVIQIVDVAGSFVWQFQNVFIILLVSALAERLKSIKLRLRKIPVLHERQWKEIRSIYHSLSMLCVSMNETIGWILLLAFIGKIFFMSVLIFNHLSARRGSSTFRSYYSLLHTLGHFALLCLYPAAVEEEKLECLALLTQYPGHLHSAEMEKLLNEMATGTLAIDVFGFFKVTRGAILSVVGVVLTLQLIFFQFDAHLDSVGV